MSTQPKRLYSLEEYFELELTSEERWEYFNGEVFCMSGGSPNHSRIEGNAITALDIKLGSRGCEVFTTDMRIRVPAAPPHQLALVGHLQLFLDEVQVLVQPPVQVPVQGMPEEQEHRRRVRDEDARERSGVPEGHAHPDATRPQGKAHGRASRSANPIPRMVWISFTGKAWSTFLRKRATFTSITLSRGVARAGSFQTSRASISRDTTWR